MMIRQLVVVVLLSLLVTAAGQSVGPDAAPSWKAGVSSAVITPKTPMWMAGYASRTKPSDGKDMDLFAKALVLEDATGERVAIITADLIGIPRSVRLATAAQVEKQHGIPAANLLINLSHTHCGPELRPSRSPRTDDPDRRSREASEYSDGLVETFVRLVGEALDKRTAITAEYTQARCGFAMNRRLPTPTGFKNAPYPAGPVDHRVPVLRLRTADTKKDLSVLFGYACHCTTMGHQKFSGDYAGYAQSFIEQAYPGAVAMFINGCSGDQNPYPRRKLEYAEAHGRTLALAVESALETAPRMLKGRIQAGMEEIPLKFERVPTRAELEDLAKSSDKLDASLAARLLGHLDAGETLPATYPYPVQLLRLGSDLTLVALGGEVVVDYSLRLQKEIRDPIVWVAGYSNDVMTYIPSQRVWEEGGYEGGDAMKYTSFPSRWASGVEDTIVSAVHRLRRRLE